MARWLVQFGYDGRPFAGWARQPGRRTVEGEIRDGLARRKLAPPGSSPELSVASRTDRGVSARANALTLESPLTGGPLLRALNGVAPEIFFLAATPLPERFRVRDPEYREYRYLLAPEEPRWESWGAYAAPLTADRIDVRSLGRGLPGGGPTWRTIDRLEVEATPEGPVLRIRARSFVWGMVRKTVSALRARARGELAERDLVAALRGERRLSLPLAEPEPLVLWEVHYPIVWTHRAGAASRNQVEYLRTEGASARLRSRLLPSLGPGVMER
jgi:tRNA pseudouridine38-40 synthase